MKSLWSLFAIACVAMLVMPLSMRAEDEVKGPDLDDITCPVSGKAVSDDFTVDHNGGTVYLCCGKCVEAFEKDATKFTTKANYQLFATGQATQIGCPMSGGDLADDLVSTLGENKVKVGYCCKHCKKKVDAAEGDAQLEMVFGADAFAKGFKVGDDDDDDDDDDKDDKDDDGSGRR